MVLSETQARKILLAQAIETSGLLSDAEVDGIDDEVGMLTLAASRDAKAIGVVLAQRADILIAKVRPQHPALMLALEKLLFSRAMFLVPLLALVLGVGADRIANPHRVDLLSAPILVILTWNLVVYVVLLASLFRRSAPSSGGFLLMYRQRIHSWGGLFGRRTETGAATRASAAFLRLWQPATAALNARRLTTLMHVAAGAWALGVVLSLLGRGLFVAYGVGWESTWLDAEKLHIALNVLFAPLVSLLSLEPFTLNDIARLQIGAGSGSDVLDGRRWALMYAGLLTLVVVIPRLALAAWAAMRSRWLSRQIRIDLEDPYFQRVIDNLFPAQVRLGVTAHRVADQAALAFVLQQAPSPVARLESAGSICLINSPRGDELWWQTLHAVSGPGDLPLRQAQQTQVDMVLHVVGQAEDLVAALPYLQALGKPVLMLVRTSQEGGPASGYLLAQCRQHTFSHELPMDVLDFADFARCWPLESVLLAAMSRRVPRSRSRGMARLQAAWLQRNTERFAASVQLMGEVLQGAASDHEAVSRLSLMDRVQPARVREHNAAKKTAMQAVQRRVHERFDRLLLDLLTLHGLDAAAASELAFHAENPKFDVSGSVGVGDAAMGGAASGAAAGASIDLITGGLTLGAAAALGALAGGSAALIGTLWNNRDTPDGRVRIALGDDMLLALVQACVLRYLAVIHVHRDMGDLHKADQLEKWKAVALAQGLQRAKALLQVLYADNASGEGVKDLVSELAQMTDAVLQQLFPGSR